MSQTFNIFTGAGYSKSLKRVVDVTGALFCLVIFSPVCLLVAIAIKISSKGPVLADIPERVGQNTKKFKMYKFRSMISNAHNLLHTDKKFKDLFEQYKKDSYKLRKDPRITTVGKFIRKHSIDEIPQFINVLKGDMSLVGPRAYYPDELENQQEKFPHTKDMVKKVLTVKPGITGLWQVSGRSELNFDKRIAIDAYYVDTISLWGDIMIILKTPVVMVTGKGAI